MAVLIHVFDCSPLVCTLYRLSLLSVEVLQISPLMQSVMPGRLWIAFLLQVIRYAIISPCFSFHICKSLLNLLLGLIIVKMKTFFLKKISIISKLIFDWMFSFSRQLTLRWVMDEAKKSTKSGSLNEVSMVLLNNLLSLPFAIIMIFIFGEWDYVIHAWVNMFLCFEIQQSLLHSHHNLCFGFQRRS